MLDKKQNSTNMMYNFKVFSIAVSSIRFKRHYPTATCVIVRDYPRDVIITLLLLVVRYRSINTPTITNQAKPGECERVPSDFESSLLDLSNLIKYIN